MGYPGRNHQRKGDDRRSIRHTMPAPVSSSCARGAPVSVTSTYRDFSDATHESIVRIVMPPKAKRKGPRGGVATPFPTRLFEMLEEVHREGLEGIVAWQPHGRSFLVRKPSQFEARILPRFFSQSKMSSFQRQLNLYGFLRQNNGCDRGSYYHELFLRNRPDLPRIMVRTRVKGVGMGRTNRIDHEPDLYRLPPCLPRDVLRVEPQPLRKVTVPNVPLRLSKEEYARSQHQDARRSPSLASDPIPLDVEGSDHRHTSPAYRFQSPHRGPCASLMPIPPVNATTLSAVVTPMPATNGRRTLRPFPHLGSDLAPPRHIVSSPSSSTSSLDDMPHHPQPCTQPTALWQGLAPLPFLAERQYQDHHLYPNECISRDQQLPSLYPRYQPSVDVGTEGQSDLFEGLEFQIVDDDSLEQFESDFISDGGSVSGSSL